MQVAETFTAHACTVHNRVFVTSLNTWLSLKHPQVSMVFEDATFLEAACDYCLLLNQATQHWHTGRTRKRVISGYP